MYNCKYLTHMSKGMRKDLNFFIQSSWTRLLTRFILPSPTSSIAIKTVLPSVMHVSNPVVVSLTIPNSSDTFNCHRKLNTSPSNTILSSPAINSPTNSFSSTFLSSSPKSLTTPLFSCLSLMTPLSSIPSSPSSLCGQTISPPSLEHEMQLQNQTKREH